jgi:hypothetical protein
MRMNTSWFRARTNQALSAGFLKSIPVFKGTRGMTSEERKLIFASSLGAVFESHDFYLYGSLAAIISRLSFSKIRSARRIELASRARPAEGPAASKVGRVIPAGHVSSGETTGKAGGVIARPERSAFIFAQVVRHGGFSVASRATGEPMWSGPFIDRTFMALPLVARRTARWRSRC